MSTNRYQGVDPVLTTAAIGYTNGSMIAELLFPSIKVKQQSGKHWIYDKGRFRVNKNGRAAGANSQEVTLNLTTGKPYFCEDHALKQFVLDEDVKNAMEPEKPFIDATENVTDMHLVAREVELAATLTSTSVLTQNVTLSGTDQFNDAGSDPIGVLSDAMSAIHSNTFLTANTAVIPKQVFDVMKNHAAFIERIKYSQKGIVTAELIAEVLGVERVIIATAGKNTAKEGQTDTMGYVWGKDIILAYIAPKIEQKMLTLGLTYTWQEMQVERLRGVDEEDRKGTYVRVGNHYYDQNLVSAECGYLIKNAIA